MVCTPACCERVCGGRKYFDKRQTCVTQSLLVRLHADVKPMVALQKMGKKLPGSTPLINRLTFKHRFANLSAHLLCLANRYERDMKYLKISCRRKESFRMRDQVKCIVDDDAR